MHEPISAESARASVRRQRMVEQQLRQRGIDDERVLAAMAAVPREAFVPPTMRELAYGDSALPIDCEQTISQPYTVAFMCQAATLLGGERVLEIGTGSGYGAAVLGRLAREVYTIERIPELAEAARERLSRLGCANVHVRTGDGSLGLAEAAPYEAIVVTAGAESLPLEYVQQAAEGARIVIPIGATPRGQVMYRFVVRAGQLFFESLGGFAFVPLIGEHSWKPIDLSG